MLIRCLLWIAVLTAFPAAAYAQDDVTVMVLGVFHMGNPGRDLHNVHADDMLAPKRQAEIAAAVSSLARFHPTRIDVEWSNDDAVTQYDAYLKDTLPPKRNEVVQLGFRLAKLSGATVRGVDVEMDFPYPVVQDYAETHGMNSLFAEANAGTAKMVEEDQALMNSGTVAQILRRANDANRIRTDLAFYGRMLQIGRGDIQPGADLLAAWYKRNFYICANIVQNTKPGDRIVVIYGAGHEYPLRTCLNQMPGYKLVEPNAYLPNK